MYIQEKKAEIYLNKNWAYINIEIRQFQFIFCMCRYGMMSTSKRNNMIAGKRDGNFSVYSPVHCRMHGRVCIFANIVRIEWHTR